jgi:hypothetical protein
VKLRARYLLAGLAALTVAGGALASASALNISGGSASAGAVANGACDADGVQLSYTPTYVSASDSWRVSTVTVAGIADACAGQKVNVAIATVSGTAQAVTTTGGTTNNRSVSVPLSTSVDVGAVAGANVVIAS